MNENIKHLNIETYSEMKTATFFRALFDFDKTLYTGKSV